MKGLPLKKLRQFCVIFHRINFKLNFTSEIPGDQILIPSHLIQTRRLNTTLISHGEEEHTHFEDRFIHLSKILVDFRNDRNKEYLLQLRERFKHKNGKGLDTCNKDDIVLMY